MKSGWVYSCLEGEREHGGAAEGWVTGSHGDGFALDLKFAARKRTVALAKRVWLGGPR
ncbi:MAG: hypothetical protein GX100_03345 [candidate division WS1 bacterium]|nr:hypothetical protein [candidate division WS1 bacterium]